MKKKIILILLIGVLLIGVTGCGKTKENKKYNNGENKQTITNKEDMEKVKVDVMYATSDNYAVVHGQDSITHIIDKEGISQGTINSMSTTYQINDNGYVYEVSSNSYSKIYDKTGKKLFESSSEEEYMYGISDSNYVIKKVISSDYNSGKSVKFQLIDMKGKVIRDIKDLSLDYRVLYFGGNIYCFYNTEKTSIIYNAKTGKSKEIAIPFSVDVNSYRPGPSSYRDISLAHIKKYYEVNDNMVVLTSNYIIDEDLNVSEFKDKVALSPKYYFDKEKSTINTYDGTVVKEVTDGQGIYNIYYANDTFYVASKTHYFYTMDKDFKQTMEPVKLGKGIKTITKYGVLVYKDVATRQSAIYDFKGNLKHDFGEYYAYDPQDFIAETFIDGKSNDTKPVNINTGEVITIYK